MQSSTSYLRLEVDLAVETGPVKHGAAGFLYGLGNDGIPSANVLAPLKPQVAAQKPEGGAQHPNGDALQVSQTYRAAGGREIEIYLQDAYPSWPYDNLGLDDYLEKVIPLTRQVLQSPHPELFSFVPLNEPDQIWYNLSDRRQAIMEDWQRITAAIRALHPAARLVGPNFARYNSDFYREFLTFTRDHGCLPDVISWHELNDDFFAGWAARVADYRAMEAELGIAPREICINEYARITGDLGNPGKLIQWIARLEASKVDACLAYWTDAGSLNNLVTRDHYNRATGAWWLYRWYGGLSGQTVQVTPPDALAEGLQGLAAIDRGKRQARILFGGCAGSIELAVTGVQAVCGDVPQVHAALWETAASGLNPSAGPRCLLETNRSVQAGAFSLRVDALDPSSAYQLILSPAGLYPSAADVNVYPAIYADWNRDGSASYGPGDARVELRPAETLEFVITAATNGMVALELNWLGSRMRLRVDDCPPFDIDSTAFLEHKPSLPVYLECGIHRLVCEALASPVSITSLKTTALSAAQPTYEASAPGNTLGGSAVLTLDPAASSGFYADQVGNGAENYLQFNQVLAVTSGLHQMLVHFANAEFRGGHSYNSQVVDRFAEIQVNDQPAQKVYFRNTFTWDNYQSRVVIVDLQAGANIIRFSNSSPTGFAPRIDKIEIAPMR